MCLPNTYSITELSWANEWKTECSSKPRPSFTLLILESCVLLEWTIKGQLISKCLFGVFNFSQKTNKNKSTWGITVFKSNFFVRFLGELRLAKSPFEIISPLANQFYSNIFACTYPALCLQTRCFEKIETPKFSNCPPLIRCPWIEWSIARKQLSLPREVTALT